MGQRTLFWCSYELIYSASFDVESIDSSISVLYIVGCVCLYYPDAARWKAQIVNDHVRNRNQNQWPDAQYIILLRTKDRISTSFDTLNMYKTDQGYTELVLLYGFEFLKAISF